LNARIGAHWVLALAFLSGIPALVYQVVWTRQVGLLAGGQIGALSVVLVAFFGGLAIGTQLFGSRADRTESPLRLYGNLELGAGLFAATSIGTLHWLSRTPQLSDIALLTASAFVILPTTILLGGTLPALLRSISLNAESAPRSAGRLVGANTFGSVLGVGLAVLSIPTLGLRSSMIAAATSSVVIGLASRLLAQAQDRKTLTASSEGAERGPLPILAAAFVIGSATLGFEVLATRLATLRLGSSLYAWGLVLSLFLVGLAAGNLAIAHRARTTTTPLRDLGWIEILAASSVMLGLAILRPEFASSSPRLSTENLVRVAIGVTPAALAMGAAFPLLVRLSIRERSIAGSFGQLSAVNTLGGIAGALLAPFALLPTFGSTGAGICFAIVNAIVGMLCLFSKGLPRSLAIGATLFLIASIPILRRPSFPEDPWPIFIAEGAQSTAVVVSSWGNRTLLVDGDPEASATGNARRTEELLAVLPLIFHPNPQRFLEIGLGSGITLGTATRFSLEKIDCVEISESVIRAAPFFEPDNRGVTTHHGLATIIHADARRFLALRANTYDVISANTLHPWSVGATGLYSREYFERMAAALRPGGIAVQWIPTQRIGEESLSLILRTFFGAFPHGDLWWGAGNIIAMGSRDPVPAYQPETADQRIEAAGLSWARIGWMNALDVPSHHIASADHVRTVLGAGERLTDDRPLLELQATRTSETERASKLYKRLVAIAKADVGNGAMLFWLESLERRAAGDDTGADTRESLAADLGLRLAEHARVQRRVTSGHQDLQAGRLDQATQAFDAALTSDPGQRYALFGRAGVAIARNEFGDAIRDLEAIVAQWPDDVRAWNELAGTLARRGDLTNARAAIDRALTENPFDIRALTNAGLLALEAGDQPAANEMLGRIRTLSPIGRSAQEKFLTEAIHKAADSLR
jgi:predicted membrane-bound spermidine synthase/tetratricopeptide (TPR) repeat protein